MILLLGLGSSAFIYLTSDAASKDNPIYQYENSKIYRHNLELMGGKVSVLADSIFGWFDGLWHGRSLAFTVACLTIVLSLGFSLVAYLSPPDSDLDSGSGRST